MLLPDCLAIDQFRGGAISGLEIVARSGYYATRQVKAGPRSAALGLSERQRAGGNAIWVRDRAFGVARFLQRLELGLHPVRLRTSLLSPAGVIEQAEAGVVEE